MLHREASAMLVCTPSGPRGRYRGVRLPEAHRRMPQVSSGEWSAVRGNLRGRGSGLSHEMLRSESARAVEKRVDRRHSVIEQSITGQWLHFGEATSTDVDIVARACSSLRREQH
jgi:hypothetical protein